MLKKYTKSSYQMEMDYLTGAYRDSFRKIEEYCKNHDLRANEMDLLLGVLVKQFVQIQEEGKPVERIIGNDIEKFCNTQIRRYFPFRLGEVFFQNLIAIAMILFTITTIGAICNHSIGEIESIWRGWWNGGIAYLATLTAIMVGICYYLSIRHLLPLISGKVHENLKRLYLLLPLIVFVIVITIGNIGSISFQVSLYNTFYRLLPIGIAGICGFIAYRLRETNLKKTKRRFKETNLIQEEFEKNTQNKNMSFSEYIYECKCEIKQFQTVSRTCLLVFSILQCISLWFYYFRSFMDLFFMGAITVLFIGIAYLSVQLSKCISRMQLLELRITDVDK